MDYKAGPFAEAVKEMTNGKGVEIILDFIGAPYWEQNIDSLTIDGKLVLIGMMGGSKVEQMNLSPLLMKRIQVIGTTLRSQPVEKKIALTKEFAEFSLAKFISGAIKPVIDSIWDWEQANEAHSHMEHNKNAGKLYCK
ncbi:zinc-binding dehydrogenase [Bacillus sp. N9]